MFKTPRFGTQGSKVPAHKMAQSPIHGTSPTKQPLNSSHASRPPAHQSEFPVAALDRHHSLSRQGKIGYALLASLFFFGFFHRCSPAALSGVIAKDLGATTLMLGAIASMHFWVYTVMQVPAGMLIDRYGIRLVVGCGAALAAVGAGVFASADTVALAFVGPALIGLGVSGVFSGVMKYNMLWFSAQRYAHITGITMLLGTMGSIVAQGPVALLLDWMNWRALLLGVGLITACLSLAVLSTIHDSPADFLRGLKGRKPAKGARPVHGEPAVGHHADTASSVSSRGEHVDSLSGRRALYRLASNRQILKLVLCMAGTNGTFYAFAGLWSVPWLMHACHLHYGTAVLVTTVALVSYGLGTCLIGHLSDRTNARKPYILITSLASLCTWYVLALPFTMPLWMAIALYVVLGLSAAQVTVVISSIKEAVDVRHGATTIAISNTGVFLSAAIVQLLFGAIVDAVSGHAAAVAAGIAQAGDASMALPAAYRAAMWLPVFAAGIGMLAAMGVRETFPGKAELAIVR